LNGPLSQIGLLQMHLRSVHSHSFSLSLSVSFSLVELSNISREPRQATHPATAQTKRAVKCKNTAKVCKAAHKNTRKTNVHCSNWQQLLPSSLCPVSSVLCPASLHAFCLRLCLELATCLAASCRLCMTGFLPENPSALILHILLECYFMFFLSLSLYYFGFLLQLQFFCALFFGLAGLWLVFSQP